MSYPTAEMVDLDLTAEEAWAAELIADDTEDRGAQGENILQLVAAIRAARDTACELLPYIRGREKLLPGAVIHLMELHSWLKEKRP